MASTRIPILFNGSHDKPCGVATIDKGKLVDLFLVGPYLDELIDTPIFIGTITTLTKEFKGLTVSFVPAVEKKE